MLTRYPERFGALFCTIPLIDMRRYTKLLAGASWIAEYGDPLTSGEGLGGGQFDHHRRIDPLPLCSLRSKATSPFQGEVRSN